MNKGSKKKTKPTLIFRRKVISDYVTNPPYFCHPVIIPNKNKKSSATRFKTKHAHILNPISAKQMLPGQLKLPTNYHKSKKDASEPTKDLEGTITLSEKFSKFCELEKYDLCSSTWVKTSAKFRERRRFTSVTKQPKLTEIRENDDNDVNHDVIKRRCLLTREDRENLIFKFRESRSRKNEIRENAKLSAEKGQTASAKAITLVVNDVTRKRRLFLPPIKKITSLSRLGNVWMRDVSLAGSRRYK